MPIPSEYNTFRRLIGDFEVDEIDDTTLESYLDDAAYEASSSEGSFTTVTEFDLLPGRYKREVIILAAINFWWQRASVYAQKLSTTTGQAAQNVSEKWERAMSMIEKLQAMYTERSVLGSEPSMGNLSRFDRGTLTRVGGKSEEQALDDVT